MEASAEHSTSILSRGWLTAFIERHRLAWELSMAALTLLYVALSLLVDEGISALSDALVLALAVLFFVEFTARCWDAPSRLRYLKGHWIDLMTCLPAIGPLRALRLVRLLGLLRLAHEIREAATARFQAAQDGSSPTWIVWPTALLLWLGASEGLWLVEKGHNDGVQNFGDALYMAFITVTTVGYGDFRPITPEGKVIAGALVFVGLGLIGFLSAQLTSRWLRVEDSQKTIDTQLRAIRSEIAELKSVIAQREPDRQS
jgi:voltage-gated potassium channel